jgi:hypothetical protein
MMLIHTSEVEWERAMSGSEYRSTAAKHRWYGETSPRSDKQFDDYQDFHGDLRSRSVKTVIVDRENPPVRRSARGSED